MWQVEGELQKFLYAAHRLVVDMLNWAWKHREYKGNFKALAHTAPGRLGRVVQETDLDDRLATLAASPHLKAIRRDYFRVTHDYRAFLECGARLELNGEARETADEVFRYLYQSILNSKTFWKEYDRNRPDGFSKHEYRQAFKRGRTVCPFCDYNKVSIVATSEHFLSQASFPVLNVFWQNLIVACIDCNSGARGQKQIASEPRKKPSNVPIFHPFFDQVADHIQFAFGDEYKPLAPSPTGRRASDRIRAVNFSRVYELEKRYADEQPEALDIAELYLEAVLTKFQLATQSQPPTRSLLRQIAREYAESERRRAFAKRGQQKMVKFRLDLLTHLEGQVESLCNKLMLS